jgi:hypothetical protein
MRWNESTSRWVGEPGETGTVRSEPSSKGNGNGGGGGLHQALVAAVASKYGAQTRGFRRAIEKAFYSDTYECEGGDYCNKHVEPGLHTDSLKEAGVDVPMVPDAFAIDVDAERITAFEVNVSNELSEDRLERYAWLWFDLDAFSIDLEVFEVDKYLVEHRVPLMELYYGLCFAQPELR